MIVANSERERDDWVIALRVRIAPWQTLAQRAIELVRSEGPDSAIVRDLARAIYDEFASKQPLSVEPIRDVGVSAHAEITAASSTTIEAVETFGRGSVVPELVGTVAAIIKVARDKTGGVVETAQAVADIVKCVSIVGAVFQAVAITARCIRMVSEASRGRPCLSRLHLELIGLLKCTFQCAMVVVDPKAAIDELRFNQVFGIKRTACRILER